MDGPKIRKDRGSNDITNGSRATLNQCERGCIKKWCRTALHTVKTVQTYRTGSLKILIKYKGQHDVSDGYAYYFR